MTRLAQVDQRHIVNDSKRDRYLSCVGLLIAALTMATSVNVGGFVAGGTDSSGYISAGVLWSKGELYRPEPLHFWATWRNAAASASPVAYRPGTIPGTEVSIHPLGSPLLCAAASSLVGAFGGYLVAPIMGGVLAWCSFMLARGLAGSLAGMLAAALVGSTPVVLLHTVHPMSDVPAAACWLLAWLMSLRGSGSASVAAGLAATMAILIRPNLAPQLKSSHSYVGMLVRHRKTNRDVSFVTLSTARGFNGASTACYCRAHRTGN